MYEFKACLVLGSEFPEINAVFDQKYFISLILGDLWPTQV